MLDITKLDPALVAHIGDLRKEAASWRLKRNKAQDYANKVTESNAKLRHELASLRAEVEALRAELGR